MDPTETLRRWREAVSRGAQHEAAKLRKDLRRWLDRGGFEPEWKSLKERARFFTRHSARHNPAEDSIWDMIVLPVALIGVAVVVYRIATTPSQPQIEPSAAPVSVGLTDADHVAIRDVQDKLRSIGFDPGPSTGDWNPATHAAIAGFQQREGLTPSDGILNGNTATRLVAVYERKTGQREDSFRNRISSLFVLAAV